MSCASGITTLVQQVFKKKKLSKMKIVPSLRHLGGIRFKYWPGNWLKYLWWILVEVLSPTIQIQ